MENLNKLSPDFQNTENEELYNKMKNMYSENGRI